GRKGWGGWRMVRGWGDRRAVGRSVWLSRCRRERPRLVQVAADHLTRQGIEEQASRAVSLEVEHVEQAPGLLVERLAAEPAEVPVVLDEPQDRSLVGERTVHEVRLREGRHDDQRKAGTVATAALKDAGLGGSAAARAREAVFRRLRLADDGAHHVVVPAIRVVVGDDDGRLLPLAGAHQGVDDGHEELLLGQWGRGGGLAVLVPRGL